MSPQLRHRYATIGGRSPLLECTKAQAEALAVAFGGIPVYVGMRHWHPYIGDVMRLPVRDSPVPGYPIPGRMREAKFRQAAFVYLHVAILYEAAAYVMWRQGLLPTRFGPPWLWLLVAAGVTAVVVYGLLRWHNAWFARAVWLLHSLRLPALINGAFFAGAEERVVPAFYLTAIVVVMINLWMLARAGWDL